VPLGPAGRAARHRRQGVFLSDTAYNLRLAMIAGNSNGRTIYVAIVADVIGLLASGVDAEAVKDVSPRTGFVVATTTAQALWQASNTIALDADVGDTVCIYAKSGSRNFEGAVLIEDVSLINDGDSLQSFALVNVPRSTVAPYDDNSVFPARFSEQNFWFWQCAVARDGAPHCSVLLAVYDRDERGRPRFAGHYRWGLQLTVKSTSPSPVVQTRERRHE